MRKFLFMIICLNLQISFADSSTKVIKAVKAKNSETNLKAHLETNTLFRNSVGVGLSQHIYCEWDKLSKYKAKLDECYANRSATGLKDFANGVVSLGVIIETSMFETKYKILANSDVILDAKNCNVSLNGNVIGNYYGGYCKTSSFSDGFEITSSHLEINEYDYTISFAERDDFLETITLKDNSSAPIDGTIDLEKHTLLWNSLNIGLKFQIYCEWTQIDSYKLELKNCYEHNSVKGVASFARFFVDTFVDDSSIFEKKYTVQSSEAIIYNARSCEIKMGNKTIGYYYNGHCKYLLDKSYSHGVEITNTNLIINEKDHILTIK